MAPRSEYLGVVLLLIERMGLEVDNAGIKRARISGLVFRLRL